MTGAMYAAISGMKSHMNKLNVIGNNVANVNTFGYKAGRVTFQETVYSTLTAGSDGTALTGGVNPSQLGYGCNIGTIDLDMSTANAVPTGVNLDCMIQGDSFFLVGDKSGVDVNNLSSLKLSKVGNFKFDAEGYLCDGQGNIVYGFVPQSGNTTAGPIDMNNPQYSSQLVPIRLPMKAKGDPADPNAQPTAGTPIYPGVDGGVNVAPGADTVDGTISVNTDSIKIDAGGKIMGTTVDGDTVVIGNLALGKVDNSAGLTHVSGPYYQALEGAGRLHITCPNEIGTGYLNNVPPDQITDDSVEINTTIDKLLSGFLEGSSTDLATEFSEMITTQRGYQANTRIITVTDTMLEELVNIKR